MNSVLLSMLEEAPRPDFFRPQWVDLCGSWRFELDPGRRGEERSFHQDPGHLKGEIQVPFCPESSLSSVGKEPGFSPAWYGRRFHVPPDWKKGRTLLHFGAVDFRAKVWLNGQELGAHQGGYDPFVFDISPYLQEGVQDLVLVVHDPPDPRQARGKQAFVPWPKLVSYKPYSGIWQPVWIEKAGDIFIQDAHYSPDPLTGILQVRLSLAGGLGKCQVELALACPGGEKSVVRVQVNKQKPVMEVVCPPLLAKDLHLWSADMPQLYPLRLRVQSSRGVDEVRSYTAFRDIRTKGDKILLNGEAFFQQGVLVQGYFPGGHASAPQGSESFRQDVQIMKDMGFNACRMHEKVEDPRFYAWCDALGLSVWGEMPSAYLPCEPQRRWLKEEWQRIIQRDHRHPCITTWVPLNESWGVPLISFDETQREFALEMYHLTKALDPTRLVVDNSGFEHTLTDVLDIHQYFISPAAARRYYQTLRNPENFLFKVHEQIFRPLNGLGVVSPYAPGYAYRGEPIVVSEYGGFGFYPAAPGIRSVLQSFDTTTMDIARAGNIQGYFYTQLYDTFHEKNGLLDAHRKPKVPIAAIREVNQRAAWRKQN